MKGLFAKKSIHDLKEEAEGKGLTRSLSGFQLILLGVGAIIGAGIFVMTGQAAAEYAGPAVVLSFLLAALVCIVAALCYAEFASIIPIAGGPYSYAYATLGEFAAWTIGWVLTLEYLFSASTVSVAWSGYFTAFIADFGLSIPATLSQSPFIYDTLNGWSQSGAMINLPAVCIVAFIGVMIALGIKIAATLNNVLVVIKFGVILLFIACGIAFIKTGNWTPFIPENTGTFGSFGWSGILRGAGVVFFAYIGFDAIATLAQESRNPQKDLPAGMIGSLSISAITYVIVALVLTGVVAYTQLGGAAPFAAAVDALGPNFYWMRFVSKFAILAGLTSVILVMLLGQTRIFYTMSQDGLLPKIFGKVHKKYHTPFYNTLIFTAAAMVICGFFPLGVLGQIVSMGALMAFAIVCFGVLVLRYKQPSLHRPFKVPFFPWVPLFGTFISLILMIGLPSINWIQLVIWIFLGYIVYFGYSVKHSHVRKKNAIK